MAGVRPLLAATMYPPSRKSQSKVTSGSLAGMTEESLSSMLAPLALRPRVSTSLP